MSDCVVQLPDYDAHDLATQVEALPADVIDRLPFGAIRIDAAGKVALYSAVERRQSGYKNRPALGLDFFHEIAPCMNTPEMRGRVELARQTGDLDIEIGWIGDFADRDRELTIRIMSASDGGLWLFNRREDGA